MNTEFAVHKLNGDGLRKSEAIANQFNNLYGFLKTKLEEACFFAKKAMAIDLQNQATAKTPFKSLVGEKIIMNDRDKAPWGTRVRVIEHEETNNRIRVEFESVNCQVETPWVGKDRCTLLDGNPIW